MFYFSFFDKISAFSLMDKLDMAMEQVDRLFAIQIQESIDNNFEGQFFPFTVIFRVLFQQV